MNIIHFPGSLQNFGKNVNIVQVVQTFLGVRGLIGKNVDKAHA